MDTAGSSGVRFEASTDSLPEGERCDWFHEVIAGEIAPVRIAVERPADFRADLAVLDLGGVKVSTFSYPALRSWRTPALIRRSDPEIYSLALMTESSMWISQRRTEAHLKHGDAVLFDSSHPYQAGTAGRDGAVRVTIVQLPRTRMPLPADRVDRLLAGRLSTQAGTGAIWRTFVTALAAHGPDCAPPGLERLGTVVVDLTGEFLAQHLGSSDELPAPNRRRLLMRRIDTFIDGNLGDPGLAPGTIAAAHHISVRYLHHLFRPDGQSVAATVRRRRLARCRADLARPELAALPLDAIAARWGFSSTTVFGRAFRTAYGTTPGEFRKQAARTAALRTSSANAAR
ncbi:helix-turn-helix domain-containing protein [Streptomyces uncialis]|uniref:AraC-like ligand-binding domain-containing protein n=1 Tax=Streptomyces uncialis TaxID=1048205 RepID=UPI00386DE70C|nr:helix-turn-helix domain-containing protein [Streptomyces uncialis]